MESERLNKIHISKEGILILFILMCFVVFIIVSLLVSYKLPKEDDFISSISGALVGSMCSVFLFFSGVYIVESSEKQLIHKETINISALQDNANAQVYLGKRHIDEKHYYYYMKETNKGLKSGRVLASKSYVNENNEDAYFEVYDLEFKSKLAEFINGDKVYQKEAEYIFYVPNGTVVEDFNIDLE